MTHQTTASSLGSKEEGRSASPNAREGISGRNQKARVGAPSNGPGPQSIPVGRWAGPWRPGYLDRESTLGGRATARWEPRLSQLELFSMAGGGLRREGLTGPRRLPGGRSGGRSAPG